jgi:hypothetical protein|tara:strand:- start:399 stop:887 length:489 start_codon:yes stop_codon:yes gene_type:complete
MQNLEYSKYINRDSTNIIDEDNTVIEGIANFCAINSINNNSRKATELNKAQDNALKCKNDQNKAAGVARDINNRNRVPSGNTNNLTRGINTMSRDVQSITDESSSGINNDRDANGKIINTENKNSGAKPRYNNMKNEYDQTFTTTINLGIGIIAAIFFITKH